MPIPIIPILTSLIAAADDGIGSNIEDAEDAGIAPNVAGDAGAASKGKDGLPGGVGKAASNGKPGAAGVGKAGIAGAIGGVAMTTVKSLMSGVDKDVEKDAGQFAVPKTTTKKPGETVKADDNKQIQDDMLKELQKQTRKGIPEAGKIITNAIGSKF